MSVSLPVSYGEALDKLTILEIKLAYIKDSQKLINVHNEWTELNKLLSTYVVKVKNLYKLLYKINERILNLQDDIRINKKPVTAYVDVVQENDARCRVKNKINQVLSSSFFEQKGYKKKTVVLHIPFGIEDIIKLTPVVRYLSTYFDETLVVCDKDVKDVINFTKSVFKDDDSIVITNNAEKFLNNGDDITELRTTLQWTDIKDEINGEEKYFNQFNMEEINKENMKYFT